MSLTEPWTAALVLFVLLGSSALGMLVQRALAEYHKSRETTELVHHIVVMLFTFAALVLGLLTTSVKSSFDQIDNTIRSFAVRLVELDQVLREYGSEADPIRDLLRGYAAAIIAGTWTAEPQPAGENYREQVLRISPYSIENPVLQSLSNRIGRQIRQLDPMDPMHRRLASDCISRFEDLMQKRWALVEQAHHSISAPFYLVLVFWLVVVFASFGLTAPRTLFAYTALAAGAVSIASAMFVILDMDRPFAGIFTVPSQPMRDALMYLNR
jgi:hypothetical protein